MRCTRLFYTGILLSIAISVTAQNDFNKPKDMVFIPMGSFDITLEREGKEILKTVSVDAFWMSNEISNKEYRAFIEDIEAHPDYELNWVDYKAINENEVKPITKDIVQKYILTKRYGDIKDQLIDLDQQPFDLYFSNKRYDKSPVVGISQQAAKYYCIWKTNTENRERQAKGLPLVQDYRLPVEAEWEYAAQGNNESKILTQNFPMPSQSGQKNHYGLHHMLDNVAEWTISYHQFRNKNDNNEVVIKGGTAKEKAEVSDRRFEETNYCDQWLGFRIVRSYISLEK